MKICIKQIMKTYEKKIIEDFKLHVFQQYYTK